MRSSLRGRTVSSAATCCHGLRMPVCLGATAGVLRVLAAPPPPRPLSQGRIQLRTIQGST